jgi:hypothetical protein
VVRKVTLTIEITKGQPNFELTVTPVELKIKKGTSDHYVLKTQSVKGAKVNVHLEVLGLPPGATTQLSSATDKDVQTPNSLDWTIKVDKTAVAGKYTLTFVGTSGIYEVRQNVTLEIIKQKTTSANGDNSMILLGLVIIVIVVIAVIGTLAYIMSRKKIKAAAEEPFQLPPKKRSSDMENYDTEGGASYGRPETPKTRPPRTQRPPPVQQVTVPKEPEPVVEEPTPIEEEPIQTQEEIQPGEAPVEETPEEAPPEPEPQKEEESIDDILKKLKGG